MHIYFEQLRAISKNRFVMGQSSLTLASSQTLSMNKMPSFGSRSLICLNRSLRRSSVLLVASKMPTDPPWFNRKSSSSSNVDIATCSLIREAFSFEGSKNSADCSIVSALGSFVNRFCSSNGSMPFNKI